MGLQGSAFSVRVFSYFRRIRQRGGDGEKFGLFYYVWSRHGSSYNEGGIPGGNEGGDCRRRRGVRRAFAGACGAHAAGRVAYSSDQAHRSAKVISSNFDSRC